VEEGSVDHASYGGWIYVNGHRCAPGQGSWSQEYSTPVVRLGRDEVHGKHDLEIADPNGPDIEIVLSLVRVGPTALLP
jgi:hypothetical protein